MVNYVSHLSSRKDEPVMEKRTVIDKVTKRAKHPLKKSGKHTKLVFTHENFATEEMVKEHQEGWEGALSKLSTFLMKGRR